MEENEHEGEELVKKLGGTRRKWLWEPAVVSSCRTLSV